MFEKAVRMKLRWNHRGMLSVEDLWDLPLRDLDAIFKNLTREAKASAEESLLVEATQEDAVLRLKIDIVRHIVAVKVAEREVAKNAAEVAARKQKLLGLLERKQDAALEELSAEELQKMLADL